MQKEISNILIAIEETKNGVLAHQTTVIVHESVKDIFWVYRSSWFDKEAKCQRDIPFLR